MVFGAILETTQGLLGAGMNVVSGFIPKQQPQPNSSQLYSEQDSGDSLMNKLIPIAAIGAIGIAAAVILTRKTGSK